MRRSVALVCAAFLLLRAQPARAAAEAGDAVMPNALEIVETAFGRMFNYASVRSVSLRIHRAGRAPTERSFEVAYASSGGLGRSLVRFTAPPYLRGSALLILEQPDGRSDVWVYQPSTRRPRRVAASHKGDAFFGSDLSFEDLEHHAWRTFDLVRKPDAEEQGRACFVVEARPQRESGYSKVVAYIERARLALLRLDLYKGDSGRPAKSLRIAPDDIAQVGAVLEPRRMWMREEGRDAATEVVFERTRSGVSIAEEVFAVARLERAGEDLFTLVERLERGEQP